MLFKMSSLAFNFAALLSKVESTEVKELMANEYEITPISIKQMQNILSAKVPALTSPYPTVVRVTIAQ